jgi:hypothetical protein
MATGLSNTGICAIFAIDEISISRISVWVFRPCNSDHHPPFQFQTIEESLLFKHALSTEYQKVG